MNRIKILDSAVAGRIAAGEVITGPVAVVKELTENAIDAGAGAVTVETRDGGKTYIRVTDNGGGIHPDDVLLSIQKHATSKIAGFEDMKSIASLGFRGEALSSIAAVSRLTIKTRVPGEMEGSILDAGPEGFHVKPAGLPDGTTVTVEDLFYNVPARYKFLKSAQAEGATITDLVSRLILSRPDLSFKYITNGALQLMSPGTGDLLDAIVAVYGRDIRTRLFSLSASSGALSVSGFISNPNYLFKSAKNQTVFINGRYIRSKTVMDTLSHAYGERILKAHYPFAVLDIRLPFSEVDVNVHPSKTTVMIQEEQQLLSLLDASVREALAETSLPKFTINSNPKNCEVAEQEKEEVPPAYQTPAYETGYQKKTKFEFREPADSIQFHPPADLDIWDAAKPAEPNENEEDQQEIAGVSELLDYRILGQLFDTYILVQSGETLYIIDQHAAHERMNYERLKKTEALLPQRLLFPYALKLSMADHDLLLNNAAWLTALGFELEDFGGATVKIAALPLKADQGDIRELMEDVIETLKHVRREDSAVLKDKIIRHACRISVKAGDALSGPEMQGLVSELRESKTVPICPHGRPVAVVLTKEDLEKGFKRKV